MKLTLSRSVHADFFFGHQHFNIFRIALPTRTSTSEQRSSFRLYSFSSGWTLNKLLLWTHFVYEKSLTSFTVERFNIYFEDLMWLFAHLWRLDKQDSRLKISLSWHLTSSLKTSTVELNIFCKSRRWIASLDRVLDHIVNRAKSRRSRRQSRRRSRRFASNRVVGSRR